MNKSKDKAPDWHIFKTSDDWSKGCAMWLSTHGLISGDHSLAIIEEIDKRKSARKAMLGKSNNCKKGDCGNCAAHYADKFQGLKLFKQKT
jgi:hypothetical protein